MLAPCTSGRHQSLSGYSADLWAGRNRASDGCIGGDERIPAIRLDSEPTRMITWKSTQLYRNSEAAGDYLTYSVIALHFQVAHSGFKGPKLVDGYAREHTAS